MKTNAFSNNILILAARLATPYVYARQLSYPLNPSCPLDIKSWQAT